MYIAKNFGAKSRKYNKSRESVVCVCLIFIRSEKVFDEAPKNPVYV